MRFSILVGATAAFIVVGTITSGFAVGLTEADHAYLDTQNVTRDSLVLRGLSPKEQARLHALINDSKTENDPAARAKIIRETLIEFEGNQHWEKMNPGQLWDLRKRKIQN